MWIIKIVNKGLNYSVKWYKVLRIIALDAIERLHQLHIWILFPLLGLLIGAMIGVFVFSRPQSMILGAFLGFLAGVYMAKWYLKK